MTRKSCATAPKAPKPRPPAPPETPPSDVQTVTLQIPIRDVPKKGYMSPRVDLQLNDAETETLRLMLEGCLAERRYLNNEKRVMTGADVVRCLLQEIRSQWRQGRPMPPPQTRR